MRHVSVDQANNVSALARSISFRWHELGRGARATEDTQHTLSDRGNPSRQQSSKPTLAFKQHIDVVVAQSFSVHHTASPSFAHEFWHIVSKLLVLASEGNSSFTRAFAAALR